jgi:hypothetical protein
LFIGQFFGLFLAIGLMARLSTASPFQNRATMAANPLPTARNAWSASSNLTLLVNERYED